MSLYVNAFKLNVCRKKEEKVFLISRNNNLNFSVICKEKITTTIIFERREIMLVLDGKIERYFSIYRIYVVMSGFLRESEIDRICMYNNNFWGQQQNGLFFLLSSLSYMRLIRWRWFRWFTPALMTNPFNSIMTFIKSDWFWGCLRHRLLTSFLMKVNY